MSPYTIYRLPQYEVWILHGVGTFDIEDDNVDVEVMFPDGTRFAATFFTIRNIESLLARWEITGEHADGLYFASPHSVFVRQLNDQTILAIIAHLFDSDELPLFFEKCTSRSDEGP